MILLSSIPAPQEGAIEVWLLSAAAVMAIVKYAMDMWKDHFRESPNPSGTYVTITQFEKQMDHLSDEMANDRTENKREHENIFSKMGGNERALNAALSHLQQKTSAIDERTSTTNATLSEQGRKIDLILTRIHQK